MEYFRALSNSITKPKKKTPPGLKHFIKFEKAWKSILTSDELNSDTVIIKTSLPQNLQILSDYLLQEEVRRKDSGDTTTGSCMEYLLSNNVLGNIVELATPDLPRGFRSEVMRMISNLVNLLDESFLQHKNVHKPILYIFKYYNSRPAVAVEYAKPTYLQTQPHSNSSKSYQPSFQNISSDPISLLTDRVGFSSSNSPFSINRAKTSKLGMRGWAPSREVWQTTGKERDEWEKIQLKYHEEDFVELMYIVSSKIHGYPYTLGLFFYDFNWERSSSLQPLDDTSSPSLNKKSNIELKFGSGSGNDQVNKLRKNSNDTATTENLSVQTSVQRPEQEKKQRKSFQTRQSSVTIKVPRFEFNLFTNLLRYIYFDGKVGDYSRTAILFLLELAFPRSDGSTDLSSPINHICLEKFVLEESGFASVISASLAAVYSQLPPRISLSRKKPPIIPSQESQITADIQTATELSFENSTNSTSSSNKRGLSLIVSTQSQEFINKINSYSQILNFIQDVYYRTPSPSIKESILESFQNYFLSTVLYPSILESNDNDGSSVAVMIYFDKMMQVFSHADFGRTILNFFNGEPDPNQGFWRTTANNSQETSPALSSQTKYPSTENRDVQTSKLQRRNSTLQFTLRDLICTNIQPNASSDSIIAALKLLRTILVNWCPYTIASLIDFEQISPSNVSQVWLANHTIAIKIHKRELEMYGELVINLENGAKTKSHNRLGIRTNSISVNANVNDCGNDDASISADSPDIANHQHTELQKNSDGCYRIQDTHQQGLRQSHNKSTLITPTKFNVPKNQPFYQGFGLYLADASAKSVSHAKIHQTASELLNSSRRNTQANYMLNESVQTDIPDNKESLRDFNGIYDPPSLSTKQANSKEEPVFPSTELPQNHNSDSDSRYGAGASPADNGNGKWHGIGNNIHDSTERMKIKDSDPLIRNLINLLSRYFMLSSECNLALTGVIAALISCPLRTPDSWLAFDINLLLKSTLHQPWETWVANSKAKVDNLSFLSSKYDSFTSNPNVSANSRFQAEKAGAEHEHEHEYKHKYGLKQDSSHGYSKYSGLHNGTPSDSEGELQDLSKLRIQSNAIAKKVKKDLGVIIDSEFQPDALDKSLALPSPNDTSAVPSPHTRYNNLGLNSNTGSSSAGSGNISPSDSISIAGKVPDHIKNEIQELISFNGFPEFEEFKLDMHLEKSISVLPNGATQPLLYAVLCSVVNQAAGLIPYIPDYKKRLKRARNALMGIVELEFDLDVDTNTETEIEVITEAKPAAGADDQIEAIPHFDGDHNANVNMGNSPHRCMSLKNNKKSALLNSPYLNSNFLDDNGNINGNPGLGTNSLGSFDFNSSMITDFNVPSKNNSEKASLSPTFDSPNLPLEPEEKPQHTAILDDLANNSSLNGSVYGIDASRSNLPENVTDNTRSGATPESTKGKALGSGSGSGSCSGQGSSLRSSASVRRKSSSKHSRQLGLMPPPNVNMKELLENIIILQESIKEIVAYLQIRRENGYDDLSIV